MAGDDIKALAQQVFDAFTAGEPDRLDALISPDYVEHTPVPPGWPTGLEGLKQYIRVTHTGFPDFRYTVEDMVAEGDVVAARATARGTHTGEYLGIPPTGKEASWTEMHIGRVEGGRFVEHWANSDQLGLLQQLGVIPAPEQAGT